MPWVPIPAHGFKSSDWSTLREKRPTTELFLVRISLYSVRIQENTDQKKLRTWTLFTQCLSLGIFPNRKFGSFYGGISLVTPLKHFCSSNQRHLEHLR